MISAFESVVSLRRRTGGGGGGGCGCDAGAGVGEGVSGNGFGVEDMRDDCHAYACLLGPAASEYGV